MNKDLSPYRQEVIDLIARALWIALNPQGGERPLTALGIQDAYERAARRAVTKALNALHRGSEVEK